MPHMSAVTIRGVKYQSMTAAAKALGLSPSTLYYYLSKGRIDDAGILPPMHSGKELPIRIRGVTYPSHRAAAEALGVTIAAVSKAKSRGSLDSLGLSGILS